MMTRPSRAEPARREASADASPLAMPVRETMEIVTVVFHHFGPKRCF